MEPIGFISICHGSASASGAEGSRDLAQDSPVYENDVITTAKGGSLEIQFIDDARLALSEQSEVIIDQYVYSDDAADAVIKMVEGTFRTTTGALVDINPEGFILETPLSTVGIRGTEIGSHVPGGGGPEQHFLLHFDGKPVVISPIAGGPPAILTTSGTLTNVTQAGVGAIREMSPQQSDFFKQLSPDQLRDSPPEDEEYPEDDGAGDGPDDGEEGSGEADVQMTLFGADSPDGEEGGGEMFGGFVSEVGRIGPEIMPPPLSYFSPITPDMIGRDWDPVLVVDSPPISVDSDLISIPDFPSFGPDSDGTDVSSAGYNLPGPFSNGDDYWETSEGDKSMFIFLDGDDTLAGNSDNYSMFFGGEGNDTLNTYGNNNVLVGGEGDDLLYASKGNALVGGSGSDKFYIAYDDPTNNNGVIFDFDGSEGDKLVFTDEVSGRFDTYGSGGSLLNSVKFIRFDNFGDYNPVSGESASDSNPNHHFIYAKLDSDGKEWGLYYDHDGTGAGASDPGELIFTFEGDVDLTADDIMFDTIS